MDAKRRQRLAGDVMTNRLNPFRIGDTVTTMAVHMAPFDGTVVEVWDDMARVYWRYPLGRMSDHRASELLRKVS